MPMIESQPDALARLYARSLYDLAEQHGGRAGVEDAASQLSDILELARADRKFAEFLSSRILPGKSRTASLEKIFKGRISDLLMRFLLVLSKKDRLAHLGVIAAAFDEIVQEKFGLVEVDVWTAAPIEPALREKVAQSMRKVVGKEPVVHNYIDEGMIGGLKMQVGDQLIDASIATRLRRMRERLSGPAAAEMRAKVDRIIEAKGDHS